MVEEEEEEVGKASFSDPEGFHWRIAQEGSDHSNLLRLPSISHQID